MKTNKVYFGGKFVIDAILNKATKNVPQVIVIKDGDFSDLDDMTFTCEGILFDYKESKLVDLFNGIPDLRERKLVLIDSDSYFNLWDYFIFCAEYELNPDATAYHIANTLPLFQNWRKWEQVIMGESFYSVISDRIFMKHYPIFEQMFETKQHPKYHQEGNVLVHSCLTASSMRYNGAIPLSVMKTIALAHDMGKVECTDKNFHAYGHENSQLPMTFLVEIGLHPSYFELAQTMIANHMVRFKHPSKRVIKRFMKRTYPYTEETFALLLADIQGRESESKQLLLDELLVAYNLYRSIAEEEPEPKSLIDGHTIMTLFGIQEGKEVGYYKQLCIQEQTKNPKITKEGLLLYLMEKFNVSF